MKRFTHEPATRTRFYLFLILSVLGAMIGPAFAQAERAPGLTQTVVSSLIPSTTYPAPGETLEVAVHVDMTGMPAPNNLLGSFTGYLNWDPLMMYYVGNSGALQGFTGSVSDLNAANGALAFNGAKATGQGGAFEVFIFYFIVAGPPGAPVNLDLDYSGMAAAQTFINLLPYLTIVDGQIAVVGDNNNPPVLQPIEDQSMLMADTLEVEIFATDPDGDAITLTVNNLPAFGSFIDHGDGSGLITFTPTYNHIGTYSDIEIIATDNGVPSLQDTVYFSLAVTIRAFSSLVPSDTFPFPGDTLAAAINVDMAHLPPPLNLLGSFTGSLQWDPQVLQYAGTSGLLQGFYGTINTNNTAMGQLIFQGAKVMGQAGQFDVLIFYYTVTGAPGTPIVMDLGYSAFSCAFCFMDDLLPLLTVMDGQIALVGNPAVLTDSLPPDCITLGVNPGPPVTLDIALQDTGSGLAQVQTLTLVNAALNVPPFTPGTTEQIILTAAKVNQTQPSTVLIEAFDLAGNSVVCDPVYMQAAAGIPGEFDLAQNYPNPFNPATTIRFQLPPTGQAANRLVTLKIYDITGRLVKTLLRESLPAGYYTVQWDGTGERGEGVAGGVYLYRLDAGDYVKTRKMLLVK